MITPFKTHSDRPDAVALKKQEEVQLLRLIDRDQANATVQPEEADQLRTLAHQGRLLVYGMAEGGEFDDYMSRDEWEEATKDPSAATTEIRLMNPEWANGKETVTLGEVGNCFDRKEAAAICDRLEAAGLPMENIRYDDENRTVLCDTKSAQGKFHVEAKLDDGTHAPVMVEFADEEGRVRRIPDDQLKKIATVDHGAELDVAVKLEAQDMPALSPALERFVESGGLPARRPATGATGGGGEAELGPSMTSMSHQAPPASQGSHPMDTMGKGNMPLTKPHPASPPKPPTPPKPKETEEPIQEQARPPQRPPRFIGAPTLLPRKKGMKGWIAAAAGLTGAGALGVPAATGIWSLFIDTGSEATAFVLGVMHHSLSFIA